MGQEIIYCSRCAIRIAGADFDRGKAFRVQGAGICASCVTPDDHRQMSQTPSTRVQSTTRIRTPKPSPGTSTRLPLPRQEPRPASRGPLVAALFAGAVLLLIGAYWALSGSRAPEPVEAVRPPEPVLPKKVEAPAPEAPREKPEDPQLREAREAVEAARAKSKSAPADLEAQRIAWEEAARKAALTPFFKEASAELQALREKLVAAKPPESPAPAPPPVPAPPTPPAPAPAPPAKVEPLVSPTLWAAAMAKATAGDFEGGAAELRKDPAGNPEADDLLHAGGAISGAREELSKFPAGQPIVVTFRSESGEIKKIEGVLTRAWGSRFEIRQGEETVFVEFTDLTAGSVADLVKPSATIRPRFALLCLLEGDREGAERLAGADAFPSRYWDYAKDAAAKVPKVPPRELEARRLFYAAEREFSKPETSAEAAAKYRKLLDAYADTAVVRGEQVRVKTRADAGKDYLLSAFALKGTGSFGIVAAPRSEAAWTSKADVDGAQMVGNYVEGEFAAAPGAVYKAWALVGGCCGETFTFYLQTTEGTDLNPKTRQKESIEPGAPIASLVKVSIKELAKSHHLHVVKIPKSPARWEWVALPLPKYAAPGPKKIRLISDQQGFSVGAIVVSSTRTAPPADAEVKEAAARAKASVVEQGLSLENPGEKAWRPLFDGKTKESVLRGPAPGWKVEDGKLVGIPGLNDAAQTHEEFKNTELRFRFEAQGLDRLWFNLRQGTPGAGYSISLESNLQAMDGKHELIFTAVEDKVTATLDGKPVPVTVLGAAQLGCLQFNGTGKRFAVLSIDVRP
jgi:hypothetical protein